jgi:hypothetical protein
LNPNERNDAMQNDKTQNPFSITQGEPTMTPKRETTVDRRESRVNDWAQMLVSRYPDQVRSVRWFPDGSVDVVVVRLTDDCYDVRPHGEGLYGNEAVQKGQIEQRITFDPALTCEDLDLQVFFTRPNGKWGGWVWGPGDPPAWILNEPDEEVRTCALEGDTYGPMNRYYEEVRYADRLYPPYPSEQEGQDAVTRMGVAWVEAYFRKLVADLSPAAREVFIDWVNNPPESGRRQGEMPPFILMRCKS